MHLLLIHGSFHGAWCWDRLLKQLPPNLPATCASLTMDDAAIGLAGHITQLSKTLGSLKGEQVIILAHSYAGMVLPGALAASGLEPLATVFFDAFVPEEGESAFDLLGPMAETLRASAVNGLMAPPPPHAFGIDEPSLVNWCAERLRPMPLSTHEEASPVSAFHVKLGHPIFLRCTGFPGFAVMETRAEQAGWALWSIHAGHDAMITAPERLAEQITELMEVLEPTA